jgi:predicted Zn-dependent protease
VHHKQNASDVADHDYARRQLRAGAAHSAQLLLQRLQSVAPPNIDSQHLLAVALLMQNNVSDAIEALKRLIALAPDFLPAHVDLARAYRKAQRTEEAYSQLQHVLRQNPRSPLAWLALGDVLVDIGRHPEARQAFRRGAPYS